MNNIHRYAIMLSAVVLLMFSACTKEEHTGSRTEIEIDRNEQEEGGTTGLVPEYGTAIRIDKESSTLPEGVEVSTGGDAVILPYFRTRTEIAVNCDNELELAGIPEGITVTAHPERRNTFIIENRLRPVGEESLRGTILFKRKSLDKVYPEDTLSVTLCSNPTIYTGEMSFGNSEMAHDFGKYADGCFGEIIPAAGKTIKAVFEDGEDAWIKLAEEDGRFRILGGWRPNDIKADGRKQTAYIVISDAESGMEEERYTVTRLNYGMPVTYINGTWWCKYNARGNACDFNDQILVKDDPAAKAGKELLEYLNTCTPEEYALLWGWAYIGDGEGKRITASDGAVKVDGYRVNGVNINGSDPHSLAPSGYEVASYEDYCRIFMEWWMYIDRDNGPHRPAMPWGDNPTVYVKSGNRKDLRIDEVSLPVTYHFEVYNKVNGKRNESVVFYGPGAQWNSNGINHNKILFTCYSPGGKKGWFNRFDAYGLQINAGGASDTRILRHVKSPVEYTY